jgi:biotin carboxyl carrier protein
MESKEFSDAIFLIEWMKHSGLDALYLRMGDMILDLKRYLEEERNSDTGSAENIKQQAGKQILSPRLGFFFRSEKHQDRPLADIGQQVQADDCVCLINVLDQIYYVTAGIQGHITEFFVHDGQLVEFKQPIFAVKVAEPDEIRQP